MPFQVSPGVNVSEIDLTTVVPAVSTTEAGIGGQFQWGPANTAVLISSEEELVSNFWKPSTNSAADFFTAASFLAYGNALYVVRGLSGRTAGQTTRNATTNAANTIDTIIKNDDDHEDNWSNGRSNVGPFVAKWPGALGNSLKVSTCAGANAWSSTLTGTLSITAGSTTVTDLPDIKSIINVPGHGEMERDAAKALSNEELIEIFPSNRVAILHGQAEQGENEINMRKFHKHDADILLCTTMIEVGINIPNATTIIIEDASRFGLSQLHQLRGRVGRGRQQGFCFLIYDEKSSDLSLSRLESLVNTNDGFSIAETDLKLRGAGDYFGQRQSGQYNNFKLINYEEILDNFTEIKKINKIYSELTDTQKKILLSRWSQLGNKGIDL